MNTGPLAVAEIPRAPSDRSRQQSSASRPWIFFAAALAILQFYTSRFSMNVDGVGYIDTALAYTRGDWHTAINGYWSPLYSWLLALFLGTFPAGIRSELPLVHLVNVLCFAFAFWSFQRFWKLLGTFECKDEESATVAALHPKLFDAFGYSIFLYLFVPLIRAVLADTLAAAFLFLIVTELLRWKRSGQISHRRAVALGALIASGFFAKAILLHFGVIALLCSVFDISLKKRFQAAVIALGAAAVLILPWAGALRWSTGEWSLGSSGRLNYAWFVNGAPTGEFQAADGPPTAFFPGERIRPGMQAFVVPTVQHVTYLPWYDPGRLDSRKPSLDLHGELRAVVKNLKWLRVWYLIEFAGISVALLALALLARKSYFRVLLQHHIVVIPCLALLGMYSLIFVRSYRYVAAVSLILFGVALISAVQKVTARRYVGTVLLAGLLVFWTTNVPGTAMAVMDSPAADRVTVNAAQALNATIPPGSKVAVLDTGANAYWAHLARTPIIAEIWHSDVSTFWNMPCRDRQAVLEAMQSAGAQAIVGVPPTPLRREGWQPLGESNLWMLDSRIPIDLQCSSTRP